MQIELGALYQELTQRLRATEIAAAELRGQIQLIERMIAQSQTPTMSGDPLGEPLPATAHTPETNHAEI